MDDEYHDDEVDTAGVPDPGNVPALGNRSGFHTLRVSRQMILPFWFLALRR
jgi:hypothetical protein